MDFARFFGKLRPDIFRVLLDIFAQAGHELTHLAHFLGRGAAGGARTAQRRGHRRFADRMRLADGADKLALRILLVERAAVAKPALETVSHRALQTVNDHLGSVPWRANRIEHGRKPNVPQATRDMQCRKSRTDKVAIVA